MSLRADFNQAAEDRIQRIVDRLKKTPEGEAVVDFIKHNNVVFEIAEAPSNWAASTATIIGIKNGVYEYKDPMVVLKENLTDDNFVQAIVHEIGHLNQHLQKVGNPDRILTKEEYILFYRVAEAEAQAWATEVAWSLKEAGDPGPWQAAKNVGYHEICDAYEMAVKNDPTAVADGRARRIAFDTWFEDEGRLAYYNKATTDDMIPFLEHGREKIFTTHGMSEGKLDDSWIKKIENCSSPTPYLHHPGFRDTLKDEFYRRSTDTRAPDIVKLPAGPDAPPVKPSAFARGPFV